MKFRRPAGRPLLLLAMLLAPRAATALDARLQPFTVRTWERPDGLHGVTQAPDGMLWFASQTGLSRFDGQRFVDVELGRPRELAATWVRRVLATRDGAVWAAVGAGELELVADPRPRLAASHGQPEAELLRLQPYLPLAAPGRLRRA